MTQSFCENANSCSRRKSVDTVEWHSRASNEAVACSAKPREFFDNQILTTALSPKVEATQYLKTPFLVFALLSA
jgi:hypothetical protein